MNGIVKGYWAQAVCNSDFFCIETCSGYGEGSSIDYKGSRHLLGHEANDAALGNAVLDSMAQSRFVLGSPRPGSVYPSDIEFDMDLYDYKKVAQRYEAWKKDLMDRYGYKSQKVLFDGLKNCSIERQNKLVTIRPFYREGAEGWHSLSKHSGDAPDVTLPADSSPEAIGAALRLAFSRCTE
jgi:hypothetical protein